MRVKLTRDYQCSVNGYALENFKKGDIVQGIAAKYALSDNAGHILSVEPEQKPKKKPKKPKETKPKYPKELK